MTHIAKAITSKINVMAFTFNNLHEEDVKNQCKIIFCEKSAE